MGEIRAQTDSQRELERRKSEENVGIAGIAETNAHAEFEKRKDPDTDGGGDRKDNRWFEPSYSPAFIPISTYPKKSHCGVSAILNPEPCTVHILPPGELIPPPKPSNANSSRSRTKNRDLVGTPGRTSIAMSYLMSYPIP